MNADFSPPAIREAIPTGIAASTPSQDAAPDGSPRSLDTQLPQATAVNPSPDSPPNLPVAERPLSQVHIQAAGDHLRLTFPPEGEDPGKPDSLPLSWPEVWQQFQLRLQGSDRFWQPQTPVHLVAHNRLLDARQLQDIADALATYQLTLERISTNRRQTAVAAATAGYSVEQGATIARLGDQSKNHGRLAEEGQGEAGVLNHRGEASPDAAARAAIVLAEPLYLQTTIRSGVEIRHPGSVIIVGDLNPGSSVVADGDILVWGNLRGVVHAGASGNAQCQIMALRMEPTQIRIANVVAKAPTKAPTEYYPEVAYIASGGIHISKVADYLKRLGR
ncbi:septum site-determining protein MinC [Trichothermofontia sp.]